MLLYLLAQVTQPASSQQWVWFDLNRLKDPSFAVTVGVYGVAFAIVVAAFKKAFDVLWRAIVSAWYGGKTVVAEEAHKFNQRLKELETNQTTMAKVTAKLADNNAMIPETPNNLTAESVEKLKQIANEPSK